MSASTQKVADHIKRRVGVMNINTAARRERFLKRNLQRPIGSEAARVTPFGEISLSIDL